MLLDELRELVVDRRPHLARHHRLERRRRHHQVDVALAHVPAVDDGGVADAGRARAEFAQRLQIKSLLCGATDSRQLAARHHSIPDQELRDFFDGLLRRGQADALDRAARRSRPGARA